MKSMFSLLGLLLVLAIVAVLVKRQSAGFAASSAVAAKPVASARDVPAMPTGTPPHQVDQVKKTLDQAMQSRSMPENQ